MGKQLTELLLIVALKVKYMGGTVVRVHHAPDSNFNSRRFPGSVSLETRDT